MHSSISAFDVISKELREIDSEVYPEVTAMTCATHSGKEIIIIGTQKIIQFLDRERLLLQDTQESTESK
jgi:hypothetical protein